MSTDHDQQTGGTSQGAGSAIPSVPVGTPGRDARAELPAPLPPGPQQPWRKLGPGNRTPITVVTALAAIALAIIAVVVFLIGLVVSVLGKGDSTGVLVLERGQYQLDEDGCRGAGQAEAIRGGGTIEFRAGKTGHESTLDRGELVAGTCRFTFSVVALDPDRRYQVVAPGGLQATPFEGRDIRTKSGVVVYLVTS